MVTILLLLFWFPNACGFSKTLIKKLTCGIKESCKRFHKSCSERMMHFREFDQGDPRMLLRSKWEAFTSTLKNISCYCRRSNGALHGKLHTWEGSRIHFQNMNAFPENFLQPLPERYLSQKDLLIYLSEAKRMEKRSSRRSNFELVVFNILIRDILCALTKEKRNFQQFTSLGITENEKNEYVASLSFLLPYLRGNCCLRVKNQIHIT